MDNLADLELHVRFEDVRLACCLSIVGRCRVFFHDTFPPQPRLVDSQEMRIMDIGPRSTSPSLKYIYSGHMSRVSRVFLKLKHGYVLLSCVLHVR